MILGKAAERKNCPVSSFKSKPQEYVIQMHTMAQHKLSPTHQKQLKAHVSQMEGSVRSPLYIKTAYFYKVLQNSCHTAVCSI